MARTGLFTIKLLITSLDRCKILVSLVTLIEYGNLINLLPQDNENATPGLAIDLYFFLIELSILLLNEPSTFPDSNIFNPLLSLPSSVIISSVEYNFISPKFSNFLTSSSTIEEKKIVSFIFS